MLGKTAILLYLYHTDLWEEYRNLILKNCINYDLFLGLCEEKNNDFIIKDYKKNFNNSNVEIFQNKGVDIGPFLKQLQKINEEEYPFFIKLHSKKSLLKSINWRIDLVNSLIGSKFTYLKNLELLRRENVGCVFNKLLINNNQLNLSLKIKEILKLLNLSYEKLSGSDYMMGNIYFSKTNIFKKYFSPDFISKIYDKLEGYGKIPEDGSYNHALEVVSGYIIKNENLKILDGVVKSKIIYNPDSEKNKIHLVDLYNGECTTKESIKIRGKINNNKIFWIHANTEQEYNIISKNKFIRKNVNNFDKVFYKNFNNLENVKLNKLEDHYKIFGKKEGLTTKEDIIKVFDHNFYKKLYGIKEKKYQKILQDYMIKGECGGRLFNSIIIEDNFDYGFYQSYHSIFENKKYNKYTALSDYIETKKKCNNKINYSEDIINIEDVNSLCVYSCDIKNKKDYYFMVTNLDVLIESFDKIIVAYSSDFNISLKDTKNIKFIKFKNKSNYEKYVDILKNYEVSKYDFICLTNNENIVIKNINNLLIKFKQSNCLLYSTTDSYIKTYHIDDSLLLFNSKNLEIIIKALSLNKNKIDLCKYLITNNYSIGSFFQINQEKELFWKNLFIDINDFPSVLFSSGVPCVKRKSIKYLLGIMPKCYIKKTYKGKIQSFLNINLNKKNLNKLFGISVADIRFCLILHIMDLNKFDEYERFIKLIKSKVNIDIYITTNTHNKRGFIKNKGMDIGPFIKTVDGIQKEYDYIIKLHSKNLRAFREFCFNNIINNIFHHILLLKNDRVMCSGPYIYSLKLDNLNESTINEFLHRNKIKIKNKTESDFFGGTMFIAKFKYFKEFFNKINIKEEYNILEEGSVININSTNTHAWERILTNIITNYYEMKNCSI